MPKKEQSFEVMCGCGRLRREFTAVDDIQAWEIAKNIWLVHYQKDLCQELLTLNRFDFGIAHHIKTECLRISKSEKN